MRSSYFTLGWRGVCIAVEEAKENGMAKQNPEGKAPEGLLERSADRIGEALGTAVRKMEDLGGRAAEVASDLRGRAETVGQKARKAVRRTTRRIKASGRRTRKTTTAGRSRKSTKRTATKKR
jgi:hypothetical protein